MIGDFDVWRILAGLGIFLFGMFMLEESVKNLAGRSFKKFIREYTTGRLKSIFSGMFVTSILQSSSAVSLMVLAFVGAGIMSMENAIGVIMGSNLGTTITAWIVATFGFKMNIEDFALPLVGIGGLGIIFLGKSPRYANISKLLVGFGFLFMGLDYMKSGVTKITDQIDISTIPDYGILVYLGLSIILTAVMQSSSAMIAIILTTMDAGIIEFNEGAAMIIGANVGTTVTVLLGAIGAGRVKKRVAFSHVFFNVFTAIIGFALLPVLVWIIQKALVPAENGVMGIALFHTLFNLTGVVIFVPFIGLFSKLLIKVIPDKITELTFFINNITPEVSDAAIASIRNDVLHMTKNVLMYNLNVMNIDEKLVFTETEGPASSGRSSKNLSLDQKYENIKLLQAEIFTFSAKVQSGELDEEESYAMNSILHSARNVLQAAKMIKDIKHDFDEFESADNAYLNRQFMSFRRRLIETYLSIQSVFEEKQHEEIANTMAKTLNRIKAEDQDFIKNTQNAISNSLVKDLEISTLLLVNRAFVHSSRQIIKAVLELLLNNEELKVMEGVEDAENMPG